MTTSKGTIQGYNGIATSDDKHQIILQATTCGSVGEQHKVNCRQARENTLGKTLKPAVEQLESQLNQLGTETTFATAKFTADSGFHSEKNLEFMATTGMDIYIADTGFSQK